MRDVPYPARGNRLRCVDHGRACGADGVEFTRWTGGEYYQGRERHCGNRSGSFLHGVEYRGRRNSSFDIGLDLVHDGGADQRLWLHELWQHGHHAWIRDGERGWRHLRYERQLPIHVYARRSRESDGDLCDRRGGAADGYRARGHYGAAEHRVWSA